MKYFYQNHATVFLLNFVLQHFIFKCQILKYFLISHDFLKNNLITQLQLAEQQKQWNTELYKKQYIFFRQCISISVKFSFCTNYFDKKIFNCRDNYQKDCSNFLWSRHLQPKNVQKINRMLTNEGFTEIQNLDNIVDVKISL